MSLSDPAHWLEDALAQLLHVDLALVDAAAQRLDLHRHQEDLQTVGLLLLLVVYAVRVLQTHLLHVLVEVFVLGPQTVDLGPQNVNPPSVVLVLLDLPGQIFGLLL